MAYPLVSQLRSTDKCEFKTQPDLPEGATIALKAKETAVETIIVRINKVEDKED
jgi:hypothetical protein